MEFDFKELTDFEEELLNLAQEFKSGKEAKKFLRRTGNKLQRRTLKHAKSSVNKKTGNLYKGIKRGKVYKYGPTGAFAVRVYAGKPAYHAHLVDKGHRIVVDGKEVGFVKGKHFFEAGAKEYEPQYYEDVEKFLDDMLDKHGL